MDAYEATKIVLSRIQNLDPENASKIMGILLIQDHGEKEMIRLAFGPEALLHSVVLKVRKELGLSCNSPSSPSSPLPFRPLSRQNSGLVGTNLPSPLSIPSQSTSSWANSCFSDFQNPDDIFSPNSSSSTVFSGVTSNGNYGVSSNLASSSSMNSSASPFYGSGVSDLVDEIHLQDQLSFLNDGGGSPNIGPKSPDLFHPHQNFSSSPTASGDMLFPPYGGPNSNSNWAHRRSCSVSDICLGSDVSDPSCGFGWKPCLYYARGYCKNGNSCKFLHAGDTVGDGGPLVGSPGKLDMMDHCQELLRSKSAHQQRMAAASQLMASSNFPFSPTSANKCMNLLLQQQQSDTQRAAAALMMGEDMQKFGRSRLDRGDFSMNNGCLGMMNPGSRQIYLTFPADSTFREEDVSNYFSIFGPVQDVRIPYQQKRMFGFVTFVYPETVKLILAKGNPHFVCDARVLVKPYKEKGKVPEKYRKQHGDFATCGSPTGLDSRDPFDLQLGARMFCNSQDMWRKKLEEQADLQQAIELQSRRLMSLQLLDVKRHSHHRTLSSGAAFPSPHSPNFFTQTMSPLSNRSSPEIFEENGPNPTMGGHGTIGGEKRSQLSVNEGEKVKEIKENGSSNGNGSDNSSNGKESSDLHQENDLLERENNLEHNLPDSPFASPKAAGSYFTAFSAPESDKNTVVSAPANNNLISSSLDMASLKSCYFQSPRLSSGHGAIGM